MSQYWKQNSIAIGDDDSIIWIESAPKKHDEPIVVKITSCEAPTPKTTFRRMLTLKEAESLSEMLQDIIIHQRKMQSSE